MITSCALQYNLNNKSQDAGHAGCVITSSRDKIFFLYQADGLFALVSAGTNTKANYKEGVWIAWWRCLSCTLIDTAAGHDKGGTGVSPCRFTD